MYICTGKYDVFWKDFYLSAEKYLLNEPGYEKHYFVFTDAHDLFASKANPRIHIFYQENLGWPDNTLMRFHIFLTQESELSSMDYLYFANANLEVKQFISAHEFLPQGEEKLVMCQHLGLFNKKNTKFTYERNPDSSAYIPPGAGDYYVA